MNEDHDSSFVPRVRAAIAKWQKAEDDQTPEWRVSMVWRLLFRWEMATKRSRKALERWLPQYAAIDPDDVVQKLIHHLAALPESPKSDSGLSLLNKLVKDIPVPAEWDDRRYNNLALPLANTRYLVCVRTQNDGQGLLFEDDPIRHVPAPPAPEPRFEVGYLPGLEPPPSKLVPCALLTLWNPAPASGSHGSVPRLCRVGWAPLLAVPPDARINENVSLEIELGKLAALVNPCTVTMREDGVSGYRSTQHGPQLVEALRALNDPANGGAVAWRAGEMSVRQPLRADSALPTFRRRSRLRSRPVSPQISESLKTRHLRHRDLPMNKPDLSVAWIEGTPPQSAVRLPWSWSSVPVALCRLRIYRRGKSDVAGLGIAGAFGAIAGMLPAASQTRHQPGSPLPTARIRQPPSVVHCEIASLMTKNPCGLFPRALAIKSASTADRSSWVNTPSPPSIDTINSQPTGTRCARRSESEPKRRSVFDPPWQCRRSVTEAAANGEGDRGRGEICLWISG